MRRLFEQFQPSNYQIEITINSEKLVFAGTVTIQGKKVGRPSQRLTFHQHGLTITEASIIRHDKRGDQTFEVTRINLQKSFDEVRLHAKNMLYGGNYTITMTFEAEITATMEGIYPCYYKYNGQDKKLIATQFESHHARQAFPCIDEPEAKATFDLTLVTPSGGTVLSNTPVRHSAVEKARQTTTFETTPVMSTYLLAFVHGDIHCVKGKSKSGVAVRSWATIAQPISYLEYANKEAISCLEFFEDYFQVPFPLSKIDQVALPDFDSLAMENWGLITFREVGILADPVNRSISGERLITMVVAHEMSHQWFGDLVTMKWWDDLWLNESFASIMESLAPDRLHPDWHEWEDFTASRVIGAADRDVYKDVQPVGLRVNHPDEMQTIFDPSIVYAKGARILKMLYDYIGDEPFRKGLTSYFKKFQYRNATRDDLWNELGTACGKDIRGLMTPWLEQSGTPELTVKKEGATLHLSQQRFLLGDEDTKSLWPIPILTDTPLAIDIMDTRTADVQYGEALPPIFNPNGSAHFITNYADVAALQNLFGEIKDRSLESSGRIIALSDMVLLAKNNQIQLTELLDLVKVCPHEDRDAVWSMFARVIGSAMALTDGNEKVETAHKAYRRELASYWHKKLGWNDAKGDDPNTKQLRTTIIALSVGGEDKQALKTALGKFAEAKSVEALPAEQRAVIAGAAVRFGKPSYVKQLMDEYESSGSPDVKECIAAALCSTKNPVVAQQIIDWGMKDFSVVKPQDIDHFYAFLMRNYHTRALAWQWLTGHWDMLTKQFGEGKKMEYFIWYASRPVSTPEWQKRYKAFFDPKINDLSLQRNIRISYSEIQARVDWRKREEPQLVKYFLQ